jgi:hypothetical protein
MKHAAQLHHSSAATMRRLSNCARCLMNWPACPPAVTLNERKIVTPTVGVWHAATVIRVQKRLGLA